MNPNLKPGIATIDHLRERSVIDPVTHCWHWQQAMSKGRPAIWALDLDRMDKHVMRGARAVWYIAHGTPLHGFTVWMSCRTPDCVCPAHVRRGTREELNVAMGLAGVLSTSTDAKRSGAAKGRAARGVVDTPAPVVLAVRAAAGTATYRALARRFDLRPETVSRIVRGLSYAHLLPGDAACAR